MTPTANVPLIIGHRGASGYRPEHTAEAYVEAFARGADAVEPDLVVSRDGVLVIRHENEISGTTDVAAHPEYAGRRTTKEVDGVATTGWFTEDFDWAELRTLRARERRPKIRPANTRYDALSLMCLSELITLVEQESTKLGRPLGLVAELKHSTYFDSIGLPLGDLYSDVLSEARWLGTDQLTTESFELTVLTQLSRRGVGGTLVRLLEASGTPFDRVVNDGARAASYASDLTEAGLARVAEIAGGISVDKSLLLGSHAASGAQLISRAHAAGLDVLCWTLRPENAYLSKEHSSRSNGFGDWRGEYSAILRSGVDGVFADHPDLVLEVRRELFGR